METPYPDFPRQKVEKSIFDFFFEKKTFFDKNFFFCFPDGISKLCLYRRFRIIQQFFAVFGKSF